MLDRLELGGGVVVGVEISVNGKGGVSVRMVVVVKLGMLGTGVRRVDSGAARRTPPGPVEARGRSGREILVLGPSRVMVMSLLSSSSAVQLHCPSSSLSSSCCLGLAFTISQQYTALSSLKAYNLIAVLSLAVSRSASSSSSPGPAVVVPSSW